VDHRKHWDRIGELGCVVCESKPVTIHHCKGGSMIDWFGSVISPRGTRCNHFLVIPLCPKHHTGADGIDVMPTREWESRFDLQVHYLLVVSYALGYEIWDEAGVPVPCWQLPLEELK